MSDISPAGVPHTPKYRQDAEGAKKDTSCPMYINVSAMLFWPLPGRSITFAHVFFLLTFNPHQSSNSWIAFNNACAPPRDCVESERSSTKPIRLNWPTYFPGSAAQCFRLCACTSHLSPCEMCNLLPLSLTSASNVFMKIRKSSGDRALPCATPVSKVIVAHY